MKTALVKRLERLETVQAFLEGDRRLKIEFAYLKQLPREYTVPATSSLLAGVRTGGRNAKSGPASRHLMTTRLGK